MSIKEIEAAITELPAEKVSELMLWLANYHERIWDRQIADDLENGRLDELLADVENEFEAGLAEPL